MSSMSRACPEEVAAHGVSNHARSPRRQHTHRASPSCARRSQLRVTDRADRETSTQGTGRSAGVDRAVEAASLGQHERDHAPPAAATSLAAQRDGTHWLDFTGQRVFVGVAASRGRRRHGAGRVSASVRAPPPISPTSARHPSRQMFAAPLRSRLRQTTRLDRSSPAHLVQCATRGP